MKDYFSNFSPPTNHLLPTFCVRYQKTRDLDTVTRNAILLKCIATETQMFWENIFDRYDKTPNNNTASILKTYNKENSFLLASKEGQFDVVVSI